MDVYINQLWERLGQAISQYENSLYLITSGSLLLFLYTTNKIFPKLLEVKACFFWWTVGALIVSILSALFARVTSIMSIRNRLKRLGNTDVMLEEK